MKKKSFNINIGMVSFLMIFIVPSMVTFSVLTLVTAKNQYNSSLKSVTHQENYSDASSEAYQKLQQIDHMLCQLKASTDQDNYLQFIKEKETQYGYHLDEDVIIYDVNISKQQVLHVELQLHYDETLYDVITWKCQNIDQWEPDNKIQVLQ